MTSSVRLLKKRMSEFVQNHLVKRPRCFLKKNLIHLETIFPQTDVRIVNKTKGMMIIQFY